MKLSKKHFLYISLTKTSLFGQCNLPLSTFLSKALHFLKFDGTGGVFAQKAPIKCVSSVVPAAIRLKSATAWFFDAALFETINVNALQNHFALFCRFSSVLIMCM